MTGRQRTLGLALGALTSIPVIALSYLGSRLANLPFIPFNVLDFVTRIVPRLMVIFGIDQLLSGGQDQQSPTPTPNVGALSGNLQPLLAILFVVLFGALFGLILVTRGRRTEKPRRLPLFGLAGGALIWIILVLINNYLSFPPAGALSSILWLGVLCLAWGAALGWLVQRTLFPVEVEEVDLARRRWLYVGGTGLVALILGGLGLGYFFTGGRTTGQATGGETAADGEDLGDPDTEVPPLRELVDEEISEAAESPSVDALQGRIEPAPGTRPEITANADFYNIDIVTDPPRLDPASWRVDLKGLVRRPAMLTLSDIQAYPTYAQFITLSCISNTVGGTLISTSKWTGIRLKDLLEDVGLRSGAQELYIEGADGFYESVSMEDMLNPRTLLVYAMNEEPLPYKHGYPLRIYIPNRFGMKQPKWITSMEVIGEEGPGYWVDRGWSPEAIARTTSVIDNVAVDAISDDRLPIGGIAWAGARGVSKVEVQIDDRPWEEAQLRTPALSPLTWVQWRYDWPVESGAHVARVRAYDGSGELQPIEETGRRPDGATGVHTVPFEV
ncbi:MAG: molybdopterin-dependent oxidoreductase [Anaerolineales bacterium]